MKEKQKIIKWIEKMIDEKTPKAQYFYGNYTKNKYTITVERGYKPNF